MSKPFMKCLEYQIWHIWNETFIPENFKHTFNTTVGLSQVCYDSINLVEMIVAWCYSLVWRKEPVDFFLY